MNTVNNVSIEELIELARRYFDVELKYFSGSLRLARQLGRLEVEVHYPRPAVTVDEEPTMIRDFRRLVIRTPWWTKELVTGRKFAVTTIP